jgi:cell division transport system permease protein
MGRAWQGFWRKALMSLAATLTMVLMLTLLAGFFILQNVLLASLSFVEAKVDVRAYIENTATADQVSALIARVSAMPETGSVQLVTRDQALEQFRQTQAAQGREDLTQYLETNPFYASLDVSLRSPQDAAKVTDALRGEPLIRNVLDVKDLVDRVITVTGVVRTAGLAMVAVVGVIVLFIIVNTIRLAVVARAEEIEIMRLVGASDAFIRWPFVFEGAMVGLLGAAITLAGLYFLSEPIAAFMVDFFRVLPLSFGSLARDLVLIVFGAGLGLGVLGSWLSVRTYLIR